LSEIGTRKEPLNTFFVPFHNQEYRNDVLLSQQKGKLNKNRLRIYAIKIDDNCFVITGGAIKLSQSTQENKENDREVTKMKNARDYLIRKDVFDDTSFYELLIDLE